jgi:hypothetical protein
MDHKDRRLDVTARLQRPNFWRRPVYVLLAFALIVPALILTSQDSLAQEQPRPLRNFLQRLFFGNYAPQPPAQPRTARPRKVVGKIRPKRSIKASPEPELAAVEKVENARVVLVVGDFLGSGLAEGLMDAYVESPGVRVIDRTRGSSGFVRGDYFNWPTEISPMLDAEKPAAVLVMIGSNDRQQMSVGGSREEKRTEAWTKEYETRATAFATAVREKNIPLIWVGMPAFKSSSLTSDMLAFNDIYRRVAENVKGEFVDIWDGFVDESGAFVMSGPDMNGQPVKLRSSDGINVTKAGKRKLAFYVEKPLSKILGDAVLPNGGTLGTQQLPDVTLQPGSKPATDRTVPVSLTDPEIDGGSELLGLKVTPKGKPGTPVERLTIEGIAADAAPGRADDFSGQKVAPEETTTAGGR